MNGNLIPEKRADKRGNIVTRWVKSFTGGNDSAKKIPSPGSSVTRSSRKVSSEQRAALIEKFSGVYVDGYGLHKNVDYIADKDPALFDRISSAVYEGDSIDRQFWANAIHGGMSIEYGNDPEARLRSMREAVAVFPMLRDIATNGGMDIDSNQPYDVIYAVHEVMNSSKIRNPDEETIAAVAASIYLSDSYVWMGEVKTPDYKTIRHEVERLKDKVEDIGRILPELKRRNTLDHDVIESLLSSPSQALNEGEL